MPPVKDQRLADVLAQGQGAVGQAASQARQIASADPEARKRITGSLVAIRESLSKLKNASRNQQEQVTTQTASSPVPTGDPIRDSGIRRHITGNRAFADAQASFFAENRNRPRMSEQEIRRKALEDAREQLDAIDASFDAQIAEERIAGRGRLGQTRAINAARGLAGSDFGEANREKTAGFNRQIEGNIEARRREAKAAIFSDVAKRAERKFEMQEERAREDTQQFLSFLRETRDSARQDVKSLAKSGVSIQDLNDEEYKQLLDQTEYDPVILDAVFNNNQPPEQRSDFQYINVGGGRIVRVDKTLGGEPVEFDFSVPEGFEFRMAGDIPIFVNEATQEIKKAPGFEKGVGATKRNEVELDTFTNAKGERVSVVFDKNTGKTREIKLGEARDTGTAGSGFFDPDPAEKSFVGRWIAQNSTSPEEELKELESNPAFYFWALEQAEKSDI